MQLSAETSWLGGFAEANGFTMPEATGDRVVLQWDVTEAHHQPYGIGRAGNRPGGSDGGRSAPVTDHCHSPSVLSGIPRRQRADDPVSPGTRSRAPDR